MKTNYREHYTKLAAEDAAAEEIENKSEETATEEVEEVDKPAEETPVAEETVEAESEPETLILGVVNCGRLNVRTKPTVQSDAVCVILKDDEVEVNHEESTEEFYKVITAAGAEGYCMRKFITMQA